MRAHSSTSPSGPHLDHRRDHAGRQTHVPAEVFDEAARHFDNEALASLIWQIAAINAWNRVAVATRTPSASTQTEAEKVGTARRSAHAAPTRTQLMILSMPHATSHIIPRSDRLDHRGSDHALARARLSRRSAAD